MRPNPRPSGPIPSRSHTKRRVLLGACLGAGLVALAATPWSVSSERLTGQLGAFLARYGLHLTSSGRVAVALLPVPRIKLTEIAIADGHGTILVRGTQLRGEFDVGALLGGRISLSEASLTGGTVAVQTAGGGMGVWGEAIRRWAGHADGPGSPLRRLLLRDVAVDLIDTRTGLSAHLQEGHLLLLRSSGGGLAMTGRASWRGESVELTAGTDDLAKLVAGAPQRAQLRLSSRLLDVALSGSGRIGTTTDFTGEAGASSPSLAGLLAWLTADTPVLDEAVRIAFQGPATISNAELRWPRMRIDLGADTLEGAASVRLESGRPSVAATLAADRLDLGWSSGLARNMFGSWAAGGASGLPPATASIDLRLSTEELRLGGLRLGSVAGSVLAEKGRLDLALLRANVAGGTAKGRVSTVIEDGRTDLKGQVSLDRINVAAGLSELSLLPVATGTLSLQSSFEGPLPPGRSVLPGLSGRVSATLSAGQLSGLDLAEVVRNPQPRRLAVEDRRFARTRLDKVVMEAALSGGTGEITACSFASDAGTGSLTGRVVLGEGRLGLAAKVTPLAGGATATLRVDGPWSAPVWSVGADRHADPAAQRPPTTAGAR